MQMKMVLFLEYLEEKYQAKWYLLSEENKEYKKYCKKVILNSFDEAIQYYLNTHVIDYDRYDLKIIIVEFWCEGAKCKIIVEYNQKFISIEGNLKDEVINEIFDEFKKAI